MEKYLEQFDKCLQHEQAFCSAACPFNVDVDAFISRLQEGRFNAAYKAYRDATGFPFIAAEICSQECKGSCLRNAIRGGENGAGGAAGQPIQLLKLEQATLAYATRTEPTRYNVPGKNKRVAIIGAGISGMACALRLATKKYDVTIYEKTDKTGGTLLETIDPEIIKEDFARQMEHLDYKVKYNTEVESLEDVILWGEEDAKASQAGDGSAHDDPAAAAAAAAVAAVMRSRTINKTTEPAGTYDAIYVATGAGGNSFGIGDADGFAADGARLCGKIGDTAVFLGGSLVGCDKTHALADGLRIATAIDNYTLTKNLKYPEYPTTDVQIDETQYVETEAIVPGGPLYSKEEAIAEAKRCMKCHCSACRLHCDLTDYLHKWPLRLRDEIVATTAPGKSELHATPAVRTINMCTHCGLCESTCPESIDMDGLIQQARNRMHKLDKMPWAFNDFFLRDMEFTNSDEAYLARGPVGGDAAPASESCKFAFFPGCQLGASSPDLVIKSYKLLRDIEPDTGIMLGCCGIPATWAGDMDLHQEVTDRIRKDWESLGKPVMILACPTCRNTFAEHLPEIETVFIYDVIAEHTDNCCPASAADSPAGTYAVFDPCATDMSDGVRDSVRKICSSMNLNLEPLPVQEKWTACCSYGGHGQIADPDFAKFVREKRIDESDLPYITYCINCRDAFLHEGKPATHLLDLLFGTEPKLSTVTARRQNRILLKEQLLKQLWNESPIGDEPCDAGTGGGTDGCTPAIALAMSDAVRQKISDSYILEQEAANVVEFCERTGRTLHDIDADTYTGYRKIGNLTYWVTYRKSGDVYELLNAYTHRMEIDLEMIWNGEKIHIDL